MSGRAWYVGGGPPSTVGGPPPNSLAVRISSVGAAAAGRAVLIVISPFTPDIRSDM